MEAVSLDRPAEPNDAVIWDGDRLLLLDQRILPGSEKFIALRDATETAQAIQEMVVRGAPAIGITAAYGVVLSVRQRMRRNAEDWRSEVDADIETLSASRPTAVNLFWALDRMRTLLNDLVSRGVEEEIPLKILEEAQRIHQDDIAANRRMGEFGASLIDSPTAVVTHCNAGALATGGYGTALGVIRSAYDRGSIRHVYADETRPWLQGARLTAWELHRDGIPVSLLVDGAAAARLAQGDVGWVIVGSDRIAANGDVANKIGTYSLAVLARQHGVRFMVAAPTSTVDMSTTSGADIPIEERDPGEILQCGGSEVGAPGVGAWNPVFDVTPAELVDAIVTEKGIVHNPTAERMAKHMAS